MSMENGSATELLDRPSGEPYHTTRGAEAYPEETRQAVAASVEQMRREDSNGRAVSQAIPIATQRRWTKPARKHTSPPLWAKAFEQYVSGQLATLADVALFLNCNPASVGKRAMAEKWTAAREARANALREQVQAKPELRLDWDKAELEELASMQVALAKQVMPIGQLVAQTYLETVKDVASARARMGDMTTASDGLDPICRRISALSSLSESLLGQVRILAGLPNPDKVQRSIAQQPEAVRPSTSSRPAMPESLPDNAS